MEDHYQIKLPIFEGPLDLLLSLIKENKIDIYDIPIAFITHQYLQYLEMMKELNLEIAGEFLVMAATLINIKSRMLLPVEEQEDEEEEDPRNELVQRLLEYQSFKEAAFSLREKEDEWEHFYTRKPLWIENGEPFLSEFSFSDLSVYNLLSAFKELLEKTKTPLEAVLINKETLTIKDKIAIILDKLEEEAMIRFDALFSDDRSKIQFIVTFLALLEILRLGLAKVFQKEGFGNIWVLHPEKGKKEWRGSGVLE